MRVAVVGSGLSGLLTSALLAREGVEVVRVERASVDGGRARSPLLGGLPVNLGPRAMYRGGPLAKALASLGIRPTGFVPPNAGTLTKIDGALARVPAGVADLLSSDLMSGADKRAFALAFARIAVGAHDVAPGETIAAWLARHVASPRVRALLAMLVRVATYSADGDHDARLALAQVRRALRHGVLYVDGGWASITAALVDAAGPAEHRAVSSTADLDADVVVVAGSYDEARALVPALPAATPVTTSCLDLVLERLPLPAQRVAFGVDEPTYFSVHTRPGATGRVIAHAMWSGHASREELEAWVELVQPGWRDVVVEARYLSRMVVSTLPHGHRPGIVVDERTLLAGDFVDAGTLLADNAAAAALLAVAAIRARASTKGAGRAA